MTTAEAMLIIDMTASFYIRDLEKKWRGQDDTSLKGCGGVCAPAVDRQRVRIERALNVIRAALVAPAAGEE
jgi:hypothetical protein